MTIYNTYRPTSFDDVIGQDHVVRTLRGAIARGLIGHAYLFTGPRGTGKTTIGRLFAHAVNCMPRDGFTPSADAVCEEILAGNALDVIEIDAASHTGVDDIRELRDTVALPPTRAHYKVYIIDEAHMLSRAAWNALLKTLEEPPSHVIFLFATTEVHKVPDTILSRVQRFDLTRLSTDAISDKLLRIARAEDVTLEPAAAAMIATAGSGSMRDAESLLAQVMAFTKDTISAEDVRSILGIARRDTVFALLEHVIARDATAALTTLAAVVEAGHDLRIFTTSLLGVLRHALLGSVDDTFLAQLHDTYAAEQHKRLSALATTSPVRLVKAINAFTEAYGAIPQSAIPQLPLEIAIVELAHTAGEDSDPPANPPAKHPAAKRATPQSPTPKKSATKDATASEAPTPEQSATTPSVSLTTLTRQWPAVIGALRKEHTAFAALLAHSAPHSIHDDTLTLITTNPLLVTKLSDGALRLTLQNAVATICGKRFAITVHLAEDAQPSASLIAQTMQLMRGGRIASDA